MSGTDIRMLETKLLDPNPDQHRKNFDEEALAELADSIRARGLLQNLVVRKLPKRKGRFGIIAGERRFRAAKLAGLDRLPCRVIVANDAEAFRMSLVENVQRVDVTALEEADGYAVLRDKFGMAPEAIAEAVGKPPQRIYQRLLLARLSKGVRALVGAGRLSPQAGFFIARLESQEQQMRLALAAVRRELPDRDVNRMVNVLRDGNPAEPVQIPMVEVATLTQAELAQRSRFQRALGKITAVLWASWDERLQETNRKVLRSAVEIDLQNVQNLRQSGGLTRHRTATPEPRGEPGGIERGGLN